MMQDMGIGATGSVALGVAQRSVLQNPGGATQLNKRGVSRDNFRRDIVARQQNGQIGQGQQNGQIGQGQQNGSPTIGNIPVATQLLLAPTFTPVQADAVLDQTNMRIAIPVRQVDGEFIITMQRMGGGGAAAAAPAPATPAEGAAPAAPAAPAPAEAAPAPAEAAPAPAKAAPATNGTEPAAPRERRAEEPKTDKYGLPIAPKGYVIMTMKMIDDMAGAVNWAGQAPITKMMDEYVKAQTGRAPEPLNNGTEKATGKSVTLVV
jgi:pyruvate/2-oxoglutarate dehydrogenase complex dihydrolipoamide acyltransferase (E2) component